MPTETLLLVHRRVRCEFAAWGDAWGDAKVIYHKFHARPTEFDGHRYASKKEARYAQELELRKRAGEVLFWLEQVLFRLPGSTVHRVDFLEFWADGTAHFVEVKGFDTPQGKLKRKQVEALYPITITVV